MSRTMNNGTFILFLVLVCSLLVLAGCDEVEITNTNHVNTRGVLIDGYVDDNFHNDDDYEMSDPKETVRDYTGKAGEAGCGEIIGYAKNRVPTIKENVIWTAAEDHASMELDPEIDVHVTAYILTGNYAAREKHFNDSMLHARKVFIFQRQGVDFDPVTIVNKTFSPNSSQFKDFRCTTANMNAIRNTIGSSQDGINVYYVDTVQGARNNANACGWSTNFVVMGDTVKTTELAHEIGHNFGMEHDNSLGNDNLMHQDSRHAAMDPQTMRPVIIQNKRKYLTEGQTFRGAVIPESILNNQGLRTGITRDCRDITLDTRKCVKNSKRIWSDG